jgi:hypothetical protein
MTETPILNIIPAPQLVIDNLPALRVAMMSYVMIHGAGLAVVTRQALESVILDLVPPIWAVKGFEILYAVLDDLPGDGDVLCAQAAELVARHDLYGAGERAYAVHHVIKARRGDADADTSVTAPEPDPAYKVS